MSILHFCIYDRGPTVKERICPLHTQYIPLIQSQRRVTKRVIHRGKVRQMIVNKTWDSNRTQWVKALLAECYNLGLIVEQGGWTPMNCSLTWTCTLSMCLYKHITISKCNKINRTLPFSLQTGQICIFLRNHRCYWKVWRRKQSWIFCIIPGSMRKGRRGGVVWCGTARIDLEIMVFPWSHSSYIPCPMVHTWYW